MESTGKKRCGFTVKVCETDKILASEILAGEAQVQGLGFVVVAGFELGEWERGKEVVDTGSKGGRLMPKFWCTEKLQHGRNGSRYPGLLLRI